MEVKGGPVQTATNNPYTEEKLWWISSPLFVSESHLSMDSTSWSSIPSLYSLPCELGSCWGLIPSQGPFVALIEDSWGLSVNIKPGLTSFLCGQNFQCGPNSKGKAKVSSVRYFWWLSHVPLWLNFWAWRIKLEIHFGLYYDMRHLSFAGCDSVNGLTSRSGSIWGNRRRRKWNPGFFLVAWFTFGSNRCCMQKIPLDPTFYWYHHVKPSFAST